MRAFVRRVGTKVCYTFDNGKFFFCDPAGCEEDLRKAEAGDGFVNVSAILYLLAV